MAFPLSFVPTSSSGRVPGELAREWIVRPLTGGGELELMSTKGNDWDPAEPLSVDEVLAVGSGLWGNGVVLESQRVSDADLIGLWSKPESNLTRFVLFRMPAFRCLFALFGSSGRSSVTSLGVGKTETLGHGECLLPPPSVTLERRDDEATGISK